MSRVEISMRPVGDGVTERPSDVRSDVQRRHSLCTTARWDPLKGKDREPSCGSCGRAYSIVSNRPSTVVLPDPQQRMQLSASGWLCFDFFRRGARGDWKSAASLMSSLDTARPGGSSGRRGRRSRGVRTAAIQTFP